MLEPGQGAVRNGRVSDIVLNLPYMGIVEWVFAISRAWRRSHDHATTAILPLRCRRCNVSFTTCWQQLASKLNLKKLQCGAGAEQGVHCQAKGGGLSAAEGIEA